MEETRKAYGSAVGKSEGKRLFGRSRRRLDNGIKMDPEENG
jgi:hypothetical protein